MRTMRLSWKSLRMITTVFWSSPLPNVLGITEGLAERLKAARLSVKKPLVCHITDANITGKLTRLIERARIPVYPSPERAVRGLKRSWDKRRRHEITANSRRF